MSDSRNSDFFHDEPTKENLKMVKAFSSKRSSLNDDEPPVGEEAVAKRRQQPIENYFRVKGQHLGHGKYSVVKPAIEKSTGKEWAVKIIEKRRVRNPLDLEREIIILQNLNHPHIVNYKETFESPTHLMIVTELCAGGELFDRIVERQFYTEKDAANLLWEILSVVKYLHDRDIVHRDIKPENLLYTDSSDKAKIKLIDFGFAKSVPEGTKLIGLCGTPGYMAPEIHHGTYGKPVDMFSIGVILYILLCGFPPFEDDDAYEFDYPSPEWDEISGSAKDLIDHLIVMDPEQRYTVDQTLKHPWIKTADGRKSIVPALDTLKQFNTSRQLGQGTFRSTTKKEKEKNRASVINMFGNDKNNNNENHQSEKKRSLTELTFEGLEAAGLLENLEEKSGIDNREIQLLFEIEEMKRQLIEKDHMIHKLTSILQEYQNKTQGEQNLSTVTDKALIQLKKQCFITHVNQFRLRALMSKTRCKQVPIVILWAQILEEDVPSEKWPSWIKQALCTE